MARVSVYRGNAVPREAVTPAKLVAADFSASPIAEGLKAAGRAGAEFVETEDRIQSLYDEQDVNRLDLEHIEQTAVLSDRLREARGAGAQAAATEISQELRDFNQTLLQRARSPRARQALEQALGRRTVGEIERYSAYADQEFVQDFRATNEASRDAALQRAQDLEDPTAARAELENAFGMVGRRAQFEGWEGGADGVQAQSERLRLASRFHAARTNTIARADPQAALDYARANRAEMTDEALDNIENGLFNEAGEQWAEQELAGMPTAVPAPDDPPPGLRVPGNVNLGNRPRVRNADGTTSTVLSMSIGTDEGEVLIPRVSDDGRILTEEQAEAQYRRTGRHLGIFETAEQATAYAQRLHADQARQVEGRSAASGSRWNVISRPGAARDGGRRTHQGYDIAPVGSNHGWYPTQNFRVERPRNGGRTAGLTADVVLADGTRMTLMHLRELPSAGSYRAGQLAAIAGNTGNARTTPTHFHVEAQDAQGRRVDPSHHFGAGTGGGAPATGNVETQLAAIDANPNYSYRQRQWLRTTVRRRDAEARQSRAQAWDEADRAAAGQVAQLGDGFTSISQIDTTNMNPQDVLRYSNMAASNRDRRENAQASPELMAYISYTQLANPNHYASEAFLQDVARRGGSPALLRSIGTQQGQILGTRVAADREHIWSVADPLLRAAGLDFDTLTPGQEDRQNAAERQQDAIRKNAILSNLQQLHDIWTGANPGQRPPDDVVRQWVSRSFLTTTGSAQSLLAATNDAEFVSRLSARDREVAEQGLRSNNLPVNEQTIASWTRRRLALTRRAP